MKRIGFRRRLLAGASANNAETPRNKAVDVLRKRRRRIRWWRGFAGASWRVEIACCHNLMVELIRVDRTGRASLCKNVGAGRRELWGGAPVPARLNGDAGAASERDAGLSSSAVWSVSDVYEPSGATRLALPDVLRSSEMAQSRDPSGTMARMGMGALSSDGFLDVFA